MSISTGLYPNYNYNYKSFVCYCVLYSLFNFFGHLFFYRICTTKYVLFAFFMKCLNKTINSDLRSPHNGGSEDSSLLGCYATLTGKCSLNFQRKLVLSSS